MITKITGTLTAVRDDFAQLETPVFEYEVLIADFARRQLQHQVGKPVTLYTLHYLEGNPAQGKLIPRLVGFLSQVEREFFEMFCSVDGVGVRKALRAMVRPVQDVAVMIAEQDDKGLTTLPGIGPATADRVVAKLRRKMSKFALLVSREMAGSDEQTGHDVVQETYETLLALGHADVDARRLLDQALAGKKKFTDVNDLLQAVYRQSRGGDEP